MLLRPNPRFALAALLLIVGVAGARAQDDQLAKIPEMSLPTLSTLVGAVTAAVTQDSLKMQGAAQRHDCLELVRIANSFHLGYAYLGAARTAPAAAGKTPGVEALQGQIVQARVLTFAARVRAGEWLKSCAGFTVPEDQRADPRYQAPAPVADAEFADAVADAHQGAIAVLLAAQAAGKSGTCPAVVAVGQSITLYLPYLEKLSEDLGDRPQALGPRVSRRAVDADGERLAAANADLWRRFGPACTAAANGAPQ